MTSTRKLDDVSTRPGTLVAVPRPAYTRNPSGRGGAWESQPTARFVAVVVGADRRFLWPIDAEPIDPPDTTLASNGRVTRWRWDEEPTKASVWAPPARPAPPGNGPGVT